MAGVKGKSGGYRIGSGRKTHRVESVHAMVAHRMFSVIHEYLDQLDSERDENGNLPLQRLEKAAQFVQPFALKALPSKIEMEDTGIDAKKLIDIASALLELEK